MKTNDELLFYVKDAQQRLPADSDYRLGDLLAFLEGMAPFLDKEVVVKMKCRDCDHYSSSFFPLEGDWGVVDHHEYCHQKMQPIHHLTLLAIAKCTEYSTDAQAMQLDLARSIVKNYLRPSLADKKLYDRRDFANHSIDFDIRQKGGIAAIHLGHKKGGAFIDGEICIVLPRNADPVFEFNASRVDQALEKGDVMVIEGDEGSINQLGLKTVIDRICSDLSLQAVYL